MSELITPTEPAIATRPSTEHWATLWDGTDIFYRAWPATIATEKAVFLFHRGHEHSGRFQDVVERLQLDDVNIFAWDARGHGRSPGERGYAPSAGCLIKDLDSFVRFVCEQHGVSLENSIAVGNSVAAVLLATWVHDYAPPIRGMVLVTPALRVKLYVPLAMPSLRLLSRFRPKSFVKSYVKSSMLTHDPEMASQYDNDPLITRNIAVNILIGLRDTATRLLADAGAIETPTLILTAGNDWVVHQRPQRRLFESISSPNKDIVVYQGFSHAVLHEQHRDQPIARMRRFIIKAFSQTASGPTLLNADQHGYTKAVYDRLQKPLGLLSPKRVYFGLTRFVLKTVGRLSKGISLGWKHGFDAGMSLDYVYRNQATGMTPLGRWIDRIYLNSPGWRGIRQRKTNLQEQLDRCIARLHDAHRPIRMLDVAAGPGRYILDALKRHTDKDISAVLCDRDTANLELGKDLATQLGVAGHVVYQQSDAFDASAVASLRPRPNIAIISGLFELFPENAPIRQCLNGLNEVMQEDGYLIYTNQPWHPQQELIARSLRNHRGGPWIMRCRSQEEMDQLVAAAGFEKEGMAIDEAGIFSVSVARRLPSG